MNHKEIFDFPSFNGEHPYIVWLNIILNLILIIFTDRDNIVLKFS